MIVPTLCNIPLFWPSSGDLPQPQMLSLVTIEDQIRIYKTKKSILARGAADRDVESLRLHTVSIVRRLRFQILPKPARSLLCQKRDAIDNNYGRQ